jgi:hypothetical protein
MCHVSIPDRQKERRWVEGLQDVLDNSIEESTGSRDGTFIQEFRNLKAIRPRDAKSAGFNVPSTNLQCTGPDRSRIMAIRLATKVWNFRFSFTHNVLFQIQSQKTLFNHGKKLIRSTNNYKDTKQKLQQIE